MVARVQVPTEVKRGQLIPVRVAIQHPMETGFRFDVNGRAIPKNVVNHVVCRFDGEVVFEAEMGSGIAANPYLQFTAIAERSGTFTFEWVDDKGVGESQAATITVTS